MVAGTHAIISRDVRQEKLRPICVLCNLCANLVTHAPINIRPADKTFFHIDLAIAMHSHVCLYKNNCKNYRNKSCTFKNEICQSYFVFYFRLSSDELSESVLSWLPLIKKIISDCDCLIRNATAWKKVSLRYSSIYTLKIRAHFFVLRIPKIDVTLAVI